MIRVFTLVLDVDIDEASEEYIDLGDQVEQGIVDRFDDKFGINCRILAKVSSTIPVPEGTTHYAGNLMDDPTWYKISDGYWWFWNTARNVWHATRCATHAAPPFVQKLGGE